jgi:hypothetical protein
MGVGEEMEKEGKINARWVLVTGVNFLNLRALI